jgi:uncharacterized protein with GYD domain
MAKYMLQGSYTVDGVKGLLKDGGSKRRAAVVQALESAGGKLEAFYFTFGKNDFVLIVDAPDNASSAALALTAAASGAFSGLHTTVLMTPEEVDQAAHKTIRFTPPGR